MCERAGDEIPRSGAVDRRLGQLLECLGVQHDLPGLVDGQLDQEAEIWRSLNAFNGASQLSPEDRSKIADLAYRAKSVDDLVLSNYPWFKQNAAEMGIAPAWGDRGKFVTAPDPEFCRPLFAAKSKR